jgi:hypothetical protein
LVCGDGARRPRRVIECWLQSIARTTATGRKHVYYLSLEFLIGRLMLDTVSNLDMAGEVREALAELGVDFDRIRRSSPDALWAMAASGALPPASWNRCPRSICRPSVTASGRLRPVPAGPDRWLAA